MTEFTKPRFSVPLGGKAFSEGYDRAFKVKRIKPYIAKVGNQIIVSPNDSYVAIEKQRKGKKK